MCVCFIWLHYAVRVTHFKLGNRIPNPNSFIIRRPAWASQVIYLEYDENIDPRQDDSSDGHLSLHADVEWLVGHGQWQHLIILQEGLDRDDDGVTVRETTQAQQRGWCQCGSLIECHLNAITKQKKEKLDIFKLSKKKHQHLIILHNERHVVM